VLEKRDAAAFRADPVGGYRSGDAWLYYCADPGLYGFALWGTPAPEDMGRLVALLTEELDRPQHVALVDVRDLEAALSPSFEALARYFFQHADALAACVSRSVIVKGQGMAAAIAAGFMMTVPPTFKATLADDLETGLAELGFDRRFGAAIDAAKNEARATPGLVRSVQRWLDGHREGTVEEAAAALAVAPRTLQRRLTEANTSFAEEVRRARVRAAKRLLAETDLPITTIALEVGCSSPQHLSTLFKQYEGVTPSEFRRK
jgi:AraC-like DNA-binding protein